MIQRSAIRVRNPHAVHGAWCALIIGFALPVLQPGLVRAADAGSLSAATQALAMQTRRLTNDAGQFYLAWWIPQALSEAILQDTPNAAHAGSLQALQPYIVFALSRAQVGDKGLVDLHDKADLLRGSRLTVNGQVITAVSADQSDPGAQAALELIKPWLVSVLGPTFGHDGAGIEFALYRPATGAPPPDPSLAGNMEFKLYHKRFGWQLPVWAPAAPSMTLATTSVPAAPAPRAAPATGLPAAPAAMPVPAPPATAPMPPPVAVSIAAPPPPAGAPTAAPMPAAPTPAAPTPAAPIPVQRRKVDPTSGEEFPERYNYNPYTGQKLVSQ